MLYFSGLTDYASLLLISSPATLSKSPKQSPDLKMAIFAPPQFTTGLRLSLQGCPMSLLRRTQQSEELWSATPSLHPKHQGFYCTSGVSNSRGVPGWEGSRRCELLCWPRKNHHQPSGVRNSSDPCPFC